MGKIARIHSLKLSFALIAALGPLGPAAYGSPPANSQAQAGVQMRTEGASWLNLAPPGPGLWLLPQRARSTCVQRAEFGPRGIELRWPQSLGPARLQVLHHTEGARLLVVDGELNLLSELQAPRSVFAPASKDESETTFAVDRLPLVVRQDGLGADDTRFSVTRPAALGAAHELFASACSIFDATATQAQSAYSMATFEREASKEIPWNGPAGQSVDQFFFAERTTLDGRFEELLDFRTEADGSDTLVYVQPPTTKSSEGTWTLLIQFEAQASDELESRAASRNAFEGAGTDKQPQDRARETEQNTPNPTSDNATPNPYPSQQGWVLFNGPDHLPVVHFEGPPLQLDIRPTMGPGLALGDVDRDGFVDLYFVQGGGREAAHAPANRLFRNQFGSERGGFAEWEASGSEDTGLGMGALFLDAEGDGDLDLYVANYGADVLFEHANENVRGSAPSTIFRDVSSGAGVGGNEWSAGIAAADTDLDGDLDLYVTSYLDFDLSKMPPVEERDRYSREDPIEMLPFAFPGQGNRFLRNDSGPDAKTVTAKDKNTNSAKQAKNASSAKSPKSQATQPTSLRFQDVTAELGLADAAGRGMQAVFWDFDRDGDPDLYVANDVSYNMLWRNEGDGTFRDVSFAAGMDDPRGGMGVSIGDVDADGDEDLFLTNWELEANALYRNNLLSHSSNRSRVATFQDVIISSGLGPYGVGSTSWGAELFDADNDGDLDLAIANGYTSPDYQSTSICVGQPNQFFFNNGRGRFELAPRAQSPGGRAPSRALLAWDFDRDGDLDLALTNNNAQLELLENRLPQAAGQHWLGLHLRGRGANTMAIGAEVSLEADGVVQRRSLRAGTSYLGGNAPELHFGLGKATGPLRISVRWPSGKLSEHNVNEVDRMIRIEEPE